MDFLKTTIALLRSIWFRYWNILLRHWPSGMSAIRTINRCISDKDGFFNHPWIFVTSGKVYGGNIPAIFQFARAKEARHWGKDGFGDPYNLKEGNQKNWTKETRPLYTGEFPSNPASSYFLIFWRSGKTCSIMQAFHSLWMQTLCIPALTRPITLWSRHCLYNPATKGNQYKRYIDLWECWHSRKNICKQSRMRWYESRILLCGQKLWPYRDNGPGNPSPLNAILTLNDLRSPFACVICFRWVIQEWKWATYLEKSPKDWQGVLSGIKKLSGIRIS